MLKTWSSLFSFSTGDKDRISSNNTVGHHSINFSPACGPSSDLAPDCVFSPNTHPFSFYSYSFQTHANLLGRWALYVLFCIWNATVLYWLIYKLFLLSICSSAKPALTLSTPGEVSRSFLCILIATSRSLIVTGNDHKYLVWEHVRVIPCPPQTSAQSNDCITYQWKP